MTDLMDRRQLLALPENGVFECECCGIGPLDVNAVDVVDGEVTCLDCVATYYPDVWARRTGEASD